MCVAHFLLLVILLSAVAETHRCNFDERQRKRGPLPVVRELPMKANHPASLAFTTAETAWAPIRLEVFTEDLNDPLQHCTEEGQDRPNFDGKKVKCHRDQLLTPEKKSILLSELIPSAIRLHSDRLLVEPMGILLVPEFRSSVCAPFSIPREHHEVGITGVDMVMYAAAGPTEGAIIAWASSCAVLDSGRPCVGAMNFGPKYIAAEPNVYRAAAHEIGHVLGFSMQSFTEKGIVTRISSLRGKSNVLIINSNKTTAVARKHFNCSTALGMELEDEGGVTTVESHWERRNAKDELMSGKAGIAYYSAFTMAVFEDLGYYRANWGKEEHMSWGKNKGCALLEEPCLQKGKTKFPDMFCTTSSILPRCTSDRLSLGVCSIMVYGQALPEEYQYFADPIISGSKRDLMDYCPYISPSPNRACSNGTQELMPGSLVGATSRCLEGDALRVEQQDIGDVCAEVRCEGDHTVSVRYLGDEAWHPCAEGDLLKPSSTFTAGRIVCPNYADVCTITPRKRSKEKLP